MSVEKTNESGAIWENLDRPQWLVDKIAEAPQEQTIYGGIAGGRTQCDEQQAHTSREEAIKNASYHGEMATASYQAAAFFEANPAFEEFIRLIRCGAIRL